MEQEELPLRDIHLPEPVGWWPPAPGWWLLFGGLLLIMLATYLLVRRWRRQTVFKLAWRELQALEAASVETQEKLRRLSILLRRVALSAYPRADVAGLTGEPWLQWLDGPLGQPGFSEGPGRLLLTGPYRPVADGHLAELFALCRDWLRRLPGAKQAPRR